MRKHLLFIYSTLCDPLSKQQYQQLDALLLRKPEGKMTWLGWLRLSPAKQNSKYMLEHIERLKMLQEIKLVAGIERTLHQNRLLKMAREGSQMTPADLSRLETSRKYATLVTIVIELTATITDEIIDLHDKIIYYEICVLSELKNALRSGDIWVQGSRQYKDFDEYLIPSETFERSMKEGTLALKYDTNCEIYLEDRL